MEAESRKLSKKNAANNNDGASLFRVRILSAMGVIFLIAFWSYYVSFPGLISSSGIEPVGRLMPFVAPWLAQRNLVIDEDSFCELAAVLGIILSCLVASGWIQHGLLFGVMVWLYSVLTRVGGTFYSFQWDILLLEAGILTCLCYAPWMRLRPTTVSTLGAWPLRFLLFKLMYMSGVVKIQADCPTWRNLTALEYHFATQCLAGPQAWHFHQVHPFLLRFSVAATLWIEIPGAFLLLLSPFPSIVSIGVILQILLQIGIIMTGNYNFFNLLTIVLCLACLEPSVSKQSQKRISMERIATWIFFIWSFTQMFVIKRVPVQDWWYSLNISVKLSKADCNALSDAVLPATIVGCLVFVLWKGMNEFRKTKNPLTAIHTLVCFIAIGVTALPLLSLTHSLQQHDLWGVKELFGPLYHSVRPYRLVNGYGLFRRMTGVGPLNVANGGWAGQPPSIVKRPEIILEGLFEDNDEEQWTELSFRWKPGDEHAMPRQVAPHQPRLDWQMWFAALSTPERTAWFLNLLLKLLDGCRPVQHLVGDQNLLSGRKLIKIRAKLYHYDFTRLDTEWNRGIPGTVLTNTTSIFQRPRQYWYRQPARIYLREIDVQDDLGLRKQLKRHGYTNTCLYGTEHQCNSQSVWCYAAVFVRKYSLYVLPVLVLMCSTLWSAVTLRRRQVLGEAPQPVVSSKKKNQ